MMSLIWSHAIGQCRENNCPELGQDSPRAGGKLAPVFANVIDIYGNTLELHIKVMVIESTTTEESYQAFLWLQRW